MINGSRRMKQLTIKIVSGAEEAIRWVAPEMIFEGTSLAKIWEGFSKLKIKGTKDRDQLADIVKAM